MNKINMKQDIDEKEYNSQTATRLAEWTNAFYANNFRSESETLYLSEKGNYFIIYEGGLFGRLHELPEVNWFGGTYIKPLTEAEAVSWCQETGNYETIEKHFPFYLKPVINSRRGL